MLAARPERFTADERRALSPYFTNLDHDVFALRNLPEVVKGALFARYSRSAKSLRRLFLDEFLDAVPAGRVGEAVGVERADRLYERVLGDYGDDSVAQLGAAHVACEGVSNLLTKVLERGRLAAYLEQSTRYVPYTDRPGGRWKYLVPRELDGLPLRERYVSTLDLAFETYRRWLEPAQDHFRRPVPEHRRRLRGRVPRGHPGPGARCPARGCCRPPRGRTSASSRRARRSRRCCCGCGPIPSRRRAPAASGC